MGADVFQAIRREIADELGYDEAERVCKNIEGAACLIERIYEKKKHVKVLEEIVEQVTRLHKQ
ncbi:MAG: hypothetical protein ACTSPG_09965 [Candidatus Hodarchaeales archaeon]